MRTFLMKLKRAWAAVLSSRDGLFWISILAMLVRLFFFPIQSDDYLDFLQPWFEELKAAGGVAAIGHPVGNYMVSYVYVLALLTHLPIPSLISIKLVSCLGDFFLAFYGMKLAGRLTQDRVLARTVYTVILFLPTVILNSAAWAQCDALYTAALLACVYYAMEERPNCAMAALGISLIWKLQAVFLAPFVFFLLLKRKISFLHLFWVPGIYLLTILPAFFAGRSMLDLLGIYFDQAGTYSALSMNAPNLYAWFWPEDTASFAKAGIVFTALFLLVFTLLLAWRRPSDDKLLLKLALFSVVMVPFLLPHMHERYFYPADVFAVLYFFLFPDMERRTAALAIETCSFLVVCRYLYAWKWVKVAWLSIPMLFVFLFLLMDTFGLFSEKEGTGEIMSSNRGAG